MREIATLVLFACITLIPPSQCSNTQSADISLQTDLADGHITQGNIYFDQGLYDIALNEYDSAIERNPNLAAAYWGRARIYHFDKGTFPKAIDDYSRAIILNPSFSEAYYYRGLAYTANGIYDKAIADFTRTVELDLSMTMAINLRAWCNANKAQWDQSSQLLLYQLLESDPGLARAYKSDAWEYVRKPQWELFTIPYLVRDANSVNIGQENSTNKQVCKPFDPALDKGTKPATPYVRIMPLSGPSGTHLCIYGWGFRGNEDGITITWDGEIIYCNIRAEIDGSLIVDGSKVPHSSSAYSGDSRAVIYVPSTTRGKHVIGVYGSSFTPVGVVKDTEFEVTPKITVSTKPSIKGTEVEINGTGFDSRETITINVDNKIADVNTSSDNTGTFNTTVVTPTIKGISYSVVASGNKGNLAQTKFIVPLAQLLPTGQKTDREEIFSNRGYAHFRKAQWALAIVDLESAYAKDATLNRGSWNKEWAQDKQQQWDNVIGDYNKLLSILDLSAPQQVAVGNNVLKAELSLAIADYVRAAELSKNPVATQKARENIRYLEQWSKDIARYDFSSDN